ncbi:DNA/RNA non-specific endonuclease [Aquimarina sp. W85]|uniref:DNA/RNA non-specific endonuclease n=1 Tax=Aquimarina rhodophyticola TaxID=3342246 RepID=UPI00366F966B
MNFRKFIYPVLAICCAFGFYYFENYLDREKLSVTTNTSSTSKYLPSSTTGMVINHKFYTLSYSEEHEQAEWVFYTLNKNQLRKKEYKRPYFINDPLVSTISADWRNYKKSGYDRGHLCPAGDRKFSYQAFEETFFTSNIAPQLPEFNQGIWNQLEQRVRYWTNKYDSLIIITGGVLTDRLASIGYESVSIPNYFYKIVLRKEQDRLHVIAFLIPNSNKTNALLTYQTSVQNIERLTNIDFFAGMDSDIQDKLESTIDRKAWKF